MEKPECPCNSCEVVDWKVCSRCRKYMPWRIAITKWMEDNR